MINHDDDKLEYFTPLTMDGVQNGTGANPRYTNGEELVCIKMNGQNFILGAVRAMGMEGQPDGPESGINPRTLDGDQNLKDPMSEQEDSDRGWGSPNPTEVHDTIQSFTHTMRYQEDKATQGREKTKNEYGNKALRYKDKNKALSIARGAESRFDNSQQVMDFIEKTVQNKGAALPEILPMLQSLKKVDGMNNPPAIKAVGPQNYIKFVGQLTSFFPALAKAAKQQVKDNKKEEEKQKREEEQLRLAHELLLEELQANAGEVDITEESTS